MKKFLFLGLLSTSLVSFAQQAEVVNIPNNQFKTALISNSEINTNGDVEIQVSEAEAFTGTIDVSGQGITDLTGIEAFINIEGLNCGYNELSTPLNVTKNVALKTLECYGCTLSSLDISKNVQLTKLDCSSNTISELDLTKNTLLEKLDCSDNQISSLDLSFNPTLQKVVCNRSLVTELLIGENPNLVELECYINSITSLDVSQAPALTKLSCYSNPLTALNVSQNVALEDLSCGESNITNLDVSQNVNLTSLSCDDAQLTSLDISQNTNLEWLYCNYNNSLTSLNLANGNNANLATLDASNNPNLTCIQIDANFTPPTDWTIDETASYNVDCNSGVADYAQLEVNIYPNPVVSVLNISAEDKIDEVTVYNINGAELFTVKSENTIDVSGLSDGVYFVEIKSNNKKTVKKIVKK